MQDTTATRPFNPLAVHRPAAQLIYKFLLFHLQSDKSLLLYYTLSVYVIPFTLKIPLPVKTLLKITLTLLPFAGYTQNSPQEHKNSEPYTSFSVEVHAPDSVLQSVPRTAIEDAISIHGLKKVTTSPSLTVSFTAQDLVISADSVRELVQKTKDSTAAGAKSSFYVEVLYSLKCEGKCYNAQNQLLFSGRWGLGQSKYVSDHMATRQAAEDYWKNNKESLKANFIASIINPAVAAMGNKLNATLP